jgi:signal transduction histidine kinase
MSRLYLQIYLGFLAILAALTLVSGLVVYAVGAPPHWPRRVAGMARLVAERLPPPDVPLPASQEALRELADRLELDAALWSADRELLAQAGAPLPHPPADGRSREVPLHRLGPPGVAIRLDDGRWLGFAPRHREERHAGALLFLLGFAGLLALGAWPLARRIAGRLERLRAGVDAFGAGALATRVGVEGKDEVAAVARSFNTAAERIEALVAAQRRVLMSASHELRSPLARLRVAAELMARSSPPELQREVEADIGELDALIDDLLLAGRLESAGIEPAPVELYPLLERECARADARLSGEPVQVIGDARGLARMFRNLLDNARRHGSGAPVDVELAARPDGGARVRVCDRGPGVAPELRERIFEPFYRPAGHSETRDGGVGLGLALVREIARAHGGDARCLARPGGGGMFEVDLARSAPGAFA